jgi:hypothetical protein
METAFLALVPKLEKALGERRKIVELHEEYGVALSISYSQFARYIERHITKKANKPVGRKAKHGEAPPPPSTAAVLATPAPARTGPISTPAQTSRKFEFDPTRANKPGRAEDLF